MMSLIRIILPSAGGISKALLLSGVFPFRVPEEIGINKVTMNGRRAIHIPPIKKIIIALIAKKAING